MVERRIFLLLQLGNLLLPKYSKLIIYKIDTCLKRRIILKPLQTGPIILDLTILIIESLVDFGPANLQFFDTLTDRFLFLTHTIFSRGNYGELGGYSLDLSVDSFNIAIIIFRMQFASTERAYSISGNPFTACSPFE